MKRTKQRTKQNALRTMIKPLALLTLLGMSINAQAIESPFAFIPLHLQTTTTNTSGSGAKPNILIQFDDSGSMLDTADGKYTEDTSKQRITIARNALNKVINNPEYFSQVNWGMLTLWNNEKTLGLASSGTKEYATNVMNGSREFAMTLPELQNLVNRLSANNATPATNRMMDSITLLRKALKYRCQKSYIILFSDGDASGIGPIPTVSNNKFKWSDQGTIHLETTLRYRTNSQDIYKAVDKRDNDTWIAHNNPEEYDLPLERMNRYTSNDGVPNGAVYYGSPYGHYYPAMFGENNGNYSWKNVGISLYTQFHNFYGNPVVTYLDPDTPPTSPLAWTQHPSSLPFLADMVYYNDLKTEAKDGKDAAGKSWDDDSSGLDPKQNIKTFSVGFGTGLSDVGKYSLDNMATANNYKALNASSQSELDAAFKQIFDTINAENVQIPPKSVATVSPSVNYDSKAPDTLNSASTIHLDLATGSSELRFYDLRQSGSGTNYVVSDKFTTPDYSKRKTIITHGMGTSRAYWFDANNGDLPFTNSEFKIDNSNDAQEWKNALLPWFTRSKPDKEIADITTNHMKYRIRSTSEPDARSMGDVLDASLVATGLSTDYRYNRQRYLVTAANDGMVYLFESSSDDNHPYTLKLNYMPSNMQRESPTDLVRHYYKNVANSNYILGANGVNPHHYLLNGDFTVRVTDNSAGQRIFMSGNMGQAGRGSYSLNIGGTKRSDGSPVGLEASENSWLTSVPLFETEKGTNNQMGYTIGAPQIGRIAPERTLAFSGSDVTATANVRKLYYATFINSGVRHPTAKDSTESALYVYSTLGGENVGLQTTASPADDSAFKAQGSLLQKISAGNNGGLAQATIVDTDFDGAIDVAYAGDFKGNLYRFDFRSPMEQWKVTRIFTTINNRPITAAPAVVRNDKNHYVVVFGTGSDLYQDDLNNKDTQSVYGIYDDLTQETPIEVMPNQLLQQTLTSPQLKGEYNQRDLSSNTFDANQHRGWFFNLTQGTGERVVVKPSTLLKTIVLTTRQYSVNTTANNTNTNAPDVCVPSSETSSTTASSWLMQFRSDSGGKLPGEGEKDADLFGYIDVTGGNTTNNYKKRATDSLIAGFQYAGGGLLSYTLIGGGRDSSKIGDQGNAYSLFGDVGTGEDIKPTEGGKEPSLCWSTTANSGQLVSTNSTDTAKGLNTTKEVYAKQCSVASLKRISWREIF